jgi:6-carboxyhexanoate--CoA ligase
MKEGVPIRKDRLWSVRMRASQEAKGKEHGAKGRRTKEREIHISGAEGLYRFSELDNAIEGYFLRAMGHPKGMADRVVITIEKMTERPLIVPLLPVSTVICNSPGEAGGIIEGLLAGEGISRRAIMQGIRIVTGDAGIPGAALVLAESGIRTEPDKVRGVRVSRLGIEQGSEKRLSAKLARKRINTATVKEAIVLASKVASCKEVMAELCISDDPDYTTGYVASRGPGYVRIPHIKKRGSIKGGRVFFIQDGADVDRVIAYLEKRPVMARM